jgi:DNA-binding MarR family transcriptional regulator
MTIEEAIQQKTFTSENQKAVINVLFTASWLHNLISQFLKPYGITHEQFNVLRILRGQHPKSILLKEITCRMVDRNSNTSRIVEKLRQKGLAERVEAPHDRRGVLISITKKGLAVLKSIDVAFAESSIPGTQSLSAAQARQLNLLLDKMRES